MKLEVQGKQNHPWDLLAFQIEKYSNKREREEYSQSYPIEHLINSWLAVTAGVQLKRNEMGEQCSAIETRCSTVIPICEATFSSAIALLLPVTYFLFFPHHFVFSVSSLYLELFLGSLGLTRGQVRDVNLFHQNDKTSASREKPDGKYVSRPVTLPKPSQSFYLSLPEFNFLQNYFLKKPFSVQESYIIR